MNISVAAIIPLYNGAAFIREALDSVLAQTEPADEIIVIDDGSTDNGPEIVKEMASRNPICLLTKTNGGQSSARNLGVAACSSTHIALLDQDDTWYPDHLAVLKQPFTKGSARDLGLVYGNLDRIDITGRMVMRYCLDDIPSPHPKTSLAQCLGQDMYILPGASLISKTAFFRVGAFDQRLSGYEDDDLFVRMFSAGFRSVYLKNVAVSRWRIHPGSTSYSQRMAASRMIYFKKLINSFPDEPRLNQYWARDTIGPRFFYVTFCEFIDGSRLGDQLRVARAWADIKEMLPVMDRRVRRRVQLVAPLIDRLHDSPLQSVARSVLRFAINRKKLG